MWLIDKAGRSSNVSDLYFEVTGSNLIQALTILTKGFFVVFLDIFR
jgi:hypothetical protein